MPQKIKIQNTQKNWIQPRFKQQKIKRRLTLDQEFDIMKLVLDKFLWLGFGIMAFGLYQVYNQTIENGIYLMLAGAVILVVFVAILVREYEIVK